MFFDAKQGKCFGELGFMTVEEQAYIDEQVAKGNLCIRKHLSPGEAVRRFYANSRPGYHSNIRERMGAVTVEEIERNKIDFGGM